MMTVQNPMNFVNVCNTNLISIPPTSIDPRIPRSQTAPKKDSCVFIGGSSDGAVMPP